MTVSATGRQWEPRNPDYENVVRNAFASQKAMALIGARLERVEPGFVEIHLPVHDGLSSGIPGIVHGGTVGMIADSALGFSALTLTAPGQYGVTAEYKINMLAPADGHTLIARGYVMKAGKASAVSRCDVISVSAERERTVATALGTLLAL